MCNINLTFQYWFAFTRFTDNHPSPWNKPTLPNISYVRVILDRQDISPHLLCNLILIQSRTSYFITLTDIQVPAIKYLSLGINQESHLTRCVILRYHLEIWPFSQGLRINDILFNKSVFILVFLSYNENFHGFSYVLRIIKHSATLLSHH